MPSLEVDTIVIGGGLLGLEAAKATYDLGLETHVIEFAPRLMPRQVDDAGSKVLVEKIEQLGKRCLYTSVLRGSPKNALSRPVRCCTTTHLHVSQRSWVARGRASFAAADERDPAAAHDPRAVAYPVVTGASARLPIAACE